MIKHKIKKGEIYLADMNPNVGSEQGGVRPVLIIQNNKGNRYSPTTIVACLTSRVHTKALLPTHYLLPDDIGLRYIDLITSHKCSWENYQKYYQVVDEVISILKTHQELNPSTKGLRNSPRWQGYSSYIRLGGKGVSVDFIRKLWKAPTSVSSPFWFKIWDDENGHWVVSDRLKQFLATIDV